MSNARAASPSAADRTGWWRRLASVLRRFPWMGRLVQRVVRLVQPRFTFGAVGVLLDPTGQRVLLVEHVFHARFPWGLPGGWIGRGESPARAVEREFMEETGLCVRAVCPLIVQLDTEWRGHMNSVFLCELNGEPQAIRLSSELLSYRWAPCDALPPLGELHRRGIEAALNARRAALPERDQAGAEAD